MNIRQNQLVFSIPFFLYFQPCTLHICRLGQLWSALVSPGISLHSDKIVEIRVVQHFAL